MFRGAENLGVQARALKFRSALLIVQSALLNLGAHSQKLGAHSERTPSGYRADTERQSGYTALVRGEEKYRRSHGLGARSHKFRAHSERIYTERIQIRYRAEVCGGELQALPRAGSALSQV